MARVKFSPIVTNIAGSVGGVTFQRNKYGNTMRQKPLPLNPASLSQYGIRQKIATIQSAWQALTDAQRLQWDRFTDFSGQSIKHNRSVRISGHSLYIKYQLMRLMCDFALLTTITYIPMPEYELFDRIQMVSPNLSLWFDNDPEITLKYFLLQISSPRPAAKSFSMHGLRYCYADENLTLQFYIEDDYLTHFGALPPVGSTLHYSIQFFSLLAPVFSSKITGKTVVSII